MNTRLTMLIGTIGGMLTLALYHHAQATDKYTIAADADTTVYASQPHQNFGQEPYLFLVSHEPPNTSTRTRIFLHFDLSSIPMNPGDRVDSAKINLVLVPQRGWGLTTVIFRQLLNPFFETQTVWDHTDAAYAGRRYTTPRDWEPYVNVTAPRFFLSSFTSQDVTHMVRHWLEARPRERNYGFVLEQSLPYACDCGGSLVFYSREAQSTNSPDLQDLIRPWPRGVAPTLTVGIQRAVQKP